MISDFNIANVNLHSFLLARAEHILFTSLHLLSVFVTSRESDREEDGESDRLQVAG